MFRKQNRKYLPEQREWGRASSLFLKSRKWSYKGISRFVLFLQVGHYPGFFFSILVGWSVGKINFAGGKILVPHGSGRWDTEAPKGERKWRLWGVFRGTWNNPECSQGRQRTSLRRLRSWAMAMRCWGRSSKTKPCWGYKCPGHLGLAETTPFRTCGFMEPWGKSWCTFRLGNHCSKKCRILWSWPLSGTSL